MVDKKVQCPVCCVKVEVRKDEGFHEVVCAQCGHPFRPSELNVER